MGKILDTLIGDTDTLDDRNFKDFDHSSEDISSGSNTLLQTATVNNKSDMLQVEQAILSGDIILLTVGPLTGVKENKVLEFLNEAVQKVNGDIVRRNQSEFIITPSSIEISRKEM